MSIADVIYEHDVNACRRTVDAVLANAGEAAQNTRLIDALYESAEEVKLVGVGGQ